VMKFLGKGNDVKVRSDITQLDLAIANFKQKFEVDYLPSTFTIPAMVNQADPNFAYLQKLFPKWMRSAAPNSPTGLTSRSLDGNQCLVFFLGGINSQGFSTSSSNPFAAVAAVGEPRIGPFFDFPMARIDPNGRFLDPWGLPYVYMTAINRGYGQSTLNGLLNGPGGPQSLLIQISGQPDKTVKIYPFVVSVQNNVPRFANPSSHQIISGGANGKTPPTSAGVVRGGIGQGSPVSGTTYQVWTPGTGEYGPGGVGGDDWSNFHERILGAP